MAFRGQDPRRPLKQRNQLEAAAFDKTFPEIIKGNFVDEIIRIGLPQSLFLA